MGGILLAGLALPAVTVAGTAANGSVEIFEALPEEFDNTALPQSSHIYAADGTTLLATFYSQNRHVVPLEEISPWMQKAIVAVEDKRFWEHNGVDGEGLLRVAYLTVSGGDTQGASTLTQQLVKNTLREAAEAKKDDEAAAAAVEVSIERKVREWRLALAYEERLNSIYGTECTEDPAVDCGKDAVLESYLNIAQFGPRVYGVEAASQLYFGIPAAQLNAIQAATIAGITQNPSKWNPLRNPENAETRRNIVLGTMLEQGMITNSEFYEYKNTPIEETLSVNYPKVSCAAAEYGAFFCDYVTKLIATHEAFKGEGSNLLYRGGLRIVTTLDIPTQIAAEQTLAEAIPMGDQSGLANALVALENTTGNIRAMAQNRIFDPTSKIEHSTAINYSVDRSYGGSRGFSPGSSFKPVILAAWLAAGHGLNEVVSAQEREWKLRDWVANCEGGGGYVGTWKPGNVEDSVGGQMTVLSATASSINTAYVAMAAKLDLCKIRDMAEAIGFHRADNAPFELVPSVTLGSQNASPLTIASVYQTFANRGMHCEPRAIDSITDLDGNPVMFSDGVTQVVPPPVTCNQAITPELADGITYALKEVMDRGSGRKFNLAGGRPSAGKTGTAQKNTHTWFAGYTPQMSAVVWVGSPDRDVPQQRITINGKYYSYVYGSTIAGPTWAKFMNRALEGQEVLGFARPSAHMLSGVPRPTPDLMCMEEKDAQNAVNDAGMRYERGADQFSAACPPGTVVMQTPAPGTNQNPGSTVIYQIATDQRPAWWYNWPAGWDPMTPPADWWGGSWPPAEFATTPPAGWDPSGGSDPGGPGGGPGGGGPGGGGPGGGGPGGGGPGGGG